MIKCLKPYKKDSLFVQVHALDYRLDNFGICAGDIDNEVGSRNAKDKKISLIKGAVHTKAPFTLRRHSH